MFQPGDIGGSGTIEVREFTRLHNPFCPLGRGLELSQRDNSHLVELAERFNRTQNLLFAAVVRRGQRPQLFCRLGKIRLQTQGLAEVRRRILALVHFHK